MAAVQDWCEAGDIGEALASTNGIALVEKNYLSSRGRDRQQGGTGTDSGGKYVAGE